MFYALYSYQIYQGTLKKFAIPNFRWKDCNKWQHKNTIYIVISVSHDIKILYGENLLSPNLNICATSKTYGAVLLFEVLLHEKHSHEKEWKEDQFLSVYLWPQTCVKVWNENTDHSSEHIFLHKHKPTRKTSFHVL